MTLKNIWQKIVDFFNQPNNSKRCNEEAIFEQELDELDKNYPGWDKEVIIADVLNFLKLGVEREILVCVYGEEIVKKAEEGKVSSQKG